MSAACNARVFRPELQRESTRSCPACFHRFQNLLWLRSRKQRDTALLSQNLFSFDNILSLINFSLFTMVFEYFSRFFDFSTKPVLDRAIEAMTNLGSLAGCVANTGRSHFMISARTVTKLHDALILLSTHVEEFAKTNCVALEENERLKAHQELLNQVDLWFISSLLGMANLLALSPPTVEATRIDMVCFFYALFRDELTDQGVLDPNYVHTVPMFVADAGISWEFCEAMYLGYYSLLQLPLTFVPVLHMEHQRYNLGMVPFCNQINLDLPALPGNVILQGPLVGTHAVVAPAVPNPGVGPAPVNPVLPLPPVPPAAPVPQVVVVPVAPVNNGPAAAPAPGFPAVPAAVVGLAGARQP